MGKREASTREGRTVTMDDRFRLPARFVRDRPYCWSSRLDLYTSSYGRGGYHLGTSWHPGPVAVAARRRRVASSFLVRAYRLSISLGDPLFGSLYRGGYRPGGALP